jgi:hypothetical protein
MVYFACFHSVINYGLIFWGNSTNVQQVFSVQKKVVRIMSGVGMRASCRHVNERKYLELKEGHSTAISTPGKYRCKPSQKSTVDYIDEEVIRSSIYNFAITEGERPTVKNLHAKLVEHIAFSGSESSLRRLLKKLDLSARGPKTTERY